MEEVMNRLEALEARLNALEGTEIYIPSANAMTLQEVVQAVGRPYNTVYSDIKNGNLKAHKYGSRVLVEQEDFERFKERCMWMDRHKRTGE